MSGAYYNEIDPFAAQWLRNLIEAGHIAPGDVDERSIEDVTPNDLKGYTQCHFFAGIGVWSHSLRRAGWADDRQVWTGSCPCQPFSVAGKRRGTDDERHLWPVFFELIRECRPAVVFGEQVASKDGLAWLSGENETMQAVRDREAVFGVLRELQEQRPQQVQGLRESAGAIPKTVEPGRSVEAAQELARQAPGLRTDECGEASSEGTQLAIRSRPAGHPGADRQGLLRDDRHIVRSGDTSRLERPITGSGHSGGWLHEDQYAGSAVCVECDGEHLGAAEDCGDCGCDRCETAGRERAIASSFDGSLEAAIEWPGVRSVFSDLEGENYTCWAADICAAGVGAPHIRQRLYWVADTVCAERPDRKPEERLGHVSRGREQGSTEITGLRGDSRPGAVNGFWKVSDWLKCRDDKWRAVKPGSFPLANGSPQRVGRLRAYGNAIVAPQAKEFIASYMETIADAKADQWGGQC